MALLSASSNTKQQLVSAVRTPQVKERLQKSLLNIELQRREGMLAEISCHTIESKSQCESRVLVTLVVPSLLAVLLNWARIHSPQGKMGQ